MNLMKTLFLSLVLCFSLNATTITYLHSSGVVQSGQFVGPATIEINDVEFEAVCYDFFRHVSVGQTWEATITPVSSLMIGDGLFGDPFKYKQVARLADEFNNQSQVVWGKIQFAIWNIMSPGAPDVAGQNGWMTSSSNAVTNNVPPFDYSNWYIVEDVQGRVQSFIIYDKTVTDTPEPSTLLTGLFGIALIGLSKFRKKA